MGYGLVDLLGRLPGWMDGCMNGWLVVWLACLGFGLHVACSN